MSDAARSFSTPLAQWTATRRHAMARQWAMAGLATAVLFAALLVGGVPLAPTEVIAALFDFLSSDTADTDQAALIIAHIRLPRALAAFAVGAVLALSGAMLQGLFRNPLADPGLIGVSAGAALAAVTTIVFASTVAAYIPDGFTRFAVPAGAFAGGFLTTLLIYRIAFDGGRARVSTMLLAGIAVNAIAMALIGLLVYVSDDRQMRDLLFWQMGSLGSVTWTILLPCVPFFALPVLLMRRLATPLNLLSLGEGEAEALGVNVERLVRTVVLMVALGVGAAVAVSGVIGFVGLVVPHLVRLSCGPDHRSLLTLSALAGGALLLAADMAARTLVVPAELPIGLVTSAVGGPFFLWLLLRHRARTVD